MSTKPASEMEALQAVHKALEPLEPETRIKVIRAVCTLLEVNTPLGNSSAQQPGQNNDIQLGGNQQASDLSKLSIKQFIMAKKPKNTYQRIACLAYFLENTNGNSKIDAKALSKANEDAKQTNISNISVFLDHAVRRHNFFSSIKGGKKQLTAFGSSVVEALPDQNKVKEVMAEHKTIKKGHKKTKNKK